MRDLETEQLTVKLGRAGDIADPERNMVDTASFDHELPPAVNFSDLNGPKPRASSIHYHSRATKEKAPVSGSLARARTAQDEIIPRACYVKAQRRKSPT